MAAAGACGAPWAAVSARDWPILTQAFTITFLAEWGDRSQIATNPAVAAAYLRTLNVAKWILELENGKGIPWEGCYSEWLDKKRQALAQEDKNKDRQDVLARELGLPAVPCNSAAPASVIEAVAKLDAHLCDIKELSIREGLHVYGTLPDSAQIPAIVERAAVVGH